MESFISPNQKPIKNLKTLTFCLIIAAAIVTLCIKEVKQVYAQQQANENQTAINGAIFPMKTNDSFAASFIEFRRGHLHAGCDFRTLRKTGIPVIAPVDGIISALHGDESGYGNMLQFEGNDGSVHFFAHLSAFEDKILELNKYVEQYRQQNFKRYPFDIDLKKYAIKVKQGQVIAYSGATGAGPAHLHYEAHNKDGIYINPLKIFGNNVLKDTTAPKISGFYLIPQDENSLIDGLPLKKYYSFGKSENASLKINAAGRFALCVRAFDENKFIANNESKTGIYKLSFTYNGKQFYSIFFDCCHTVFIKKPEYIYDILSSSYSNGNFYYNLFNLTRSASRPEYISRDNNSETGIFEIKKGESAKIEISAFDYAGNKDIKFIELTGSESTPSVPLSVVKINSPQSAAGKNKTDKKALHAKASGIKNPKTAPKTKSAANKRAENTLNTETTEPKQPQIKLDYAENALIYNISGISPQNEAVMFIEESGGTRRELKPFSRGLNRAGEIFFARGYEDVYKNPIFYIEIKNAAKQRVFYTGYKSQIYKAQPESETAMPEMNNYSFKILEYANMAKPLYFGLITPARLNEAEPPVKNNLITVGFSQLITAAKIFYKLTDESIKNPQYGIYFVYKNEKSFIDNAIDTIAGQKFMTGSIKYVKYFSAGIFKDETSPVLKISKPGAKKISKPFAYSILPDANFISFTAVDRESGISRNTVKYYIDGKKCENYELIDGWLLNCYIKNYADANADSKGQHNIKIELYDNSGNKSVFEKNITIK